MSDSTLLVALSGPTSSGKTTIATMLASIVPPSYISIIHADDFYKPDSLIPLHPNTGVQDWDCAASLDIPKFRKTLVDVKAGGEAPGDMIKQGGVGGDGVHAASTGNGLSEEFLVKMKDEVAKWSSTLLQKMRIVLVEGFLLFGEGVKDSLGELFDVKILLRATFEAARGRRGRRNGYVTLEGYWKDPEGYFEDVVWPNYVKDHRWLFEEGDVEGKVRKEVVRGEGNLMVGPVEDEDLEVLCKWVVERLRRALEVR